MAFLKPWMIVFLIVSWSHYSYTACRSNQTVYPNCVCETDIENKENFGLECLMGDEKRFTAWYTSGTLSIDCPCGMNISAYNQLELLAGSKVHSLELQICSQIPLASFGQWIDMENVYHVDYTFSEAAETLLTETFANVSALTELNFKGNDIKILPAEVFKDMKKLRNLSLNGNNLFSITENSLNGLNDLEFLQLGANRIAVVEEQTFANLKSLSQLNLESNEISELPSNLFRHLVNLSILDLSSNKISHLDENLFESNSKLATLYLRNNRLSQLSPALFAKLPKLSQLRLRGNQLSGMSSNIFDSVKSSLKILDLSNCNLTNLNAGWFIGMSKLEELDLSANQLVAIEQGLFNTLTSLKTLDLGYNRLTVIDGDVFLGLRSLENLYLENNNLRTISVKSMEPLTKMISINLANNNLTFVDEDPLFSVPGYDNYKMSPLQNNKKLKSIDLSNNKISRIFYDWSFMSSLSELNLKFNQLKQLSFEQLSLSNEVSLDLSYNQISRIDFDNGVIADIPTGNDPRTSRTIDLNGNPLSCDCFTYNFVRYVNRSLPGLLYSWNVRALELKCHEPENLRNRSPMSVEPELFTCPCEESYEPCSCTWRIADGTRLLDCRRRNLTDLLQLRGLDVNKVELDLSGNRVNLARMTDGTSPGVRVLNLSRNELDSISAPLWSNIRTRFPSLARLDLSGNNFTSVPASVLDDWNAASSLTLRLDANPWACDCSNVALLDLAFNLKQRIEDYVSMVCHTGMTGGQLSQILAEDACPANTALFSTLAIVPIILLLIVVVAFTVHRFQRDIRAWLYTHRMCLWYVEQEEEDEGLDYDAFISFSHKDEDFVTNYLVPELERPVVGLPAYRLCLHYRDWLAGEWIPAQISRSVASSKRTIVVLSNHFLESLWGQLEFRTAYEQVLKDKRMRLIVIVVGDLPNKEKMDEELKHYLSLNTYLKWDDPWFWHRLRYAMPHKEKHDGPRLSRISQAIVDHGGDALNKEHMNGAKMNQLPPLPLTDRTNHTEHIILPPDIEMSLTPTSSASSTAPIFPTN